jgi:hypothetical protein
MESWDSIDSIRTGLWAGHLKILGSIPVRGMGFISFAKHPYCLWMLLCLLFAGYWESLSVGKVAGA